MNYSLAVEMRTPPLDEHPKHSYHQMCKKVCKFYGVRDAERWFRQQRRRIIDGCLEDKWKFRNFQSLLELWETRQLEHKFTDPPVPQAEGQVSP